MVPLKLKSLYCSAMSQTLSSDFQYLFVGTNFGEIVVFSVEKISETGSLDDPICQPNLDPLQVFHVSDGHVYSLAFFREFLIVGLNYEVVGYSFKAGQLGKQAWRVPIPKSADNVEVNEVNYLWLDEENSHLYAGCGDNNIYGISLDEGKILRTFSGHTDYIHCVDGNTGSSQVVSASEDGNVKLWDMRQKKATGKLEPYKKDNLSRPEFGKWQGTVSISDDWLVCGGGPRLSLWHLRSNEVSAVFDFPGKLHVSAFLDDLVVGGGDHKTLNQYNLNASIVSEITVSASSVYSISATVSPKLLIIGGDSNVIDICTNFNYRDFGLKIY